MGVQELQERIGEQWSMDGLSADTLMSELTEAQELRFQAAFAAEEAKALQEESFRQEERAAQHASIKLGHRRLLLEEASMAEVESVKAEWLEQLLIEECHCAKVALAEGEGLRRELRDLSRMSRWMSP